MSTTDYAQTRHAANNRIKKAQALAVKAAEMGLQPYELTLPGSFGTLADHRRREDVRKACGMKSKPSEQTWADALTELEVGTRTRPNARECPSCHWAIVTVRTARGTRINVDPFPHPDGTVYMRGEGHRADAVVVTGTDTPPDGSPLFRQHVTSCPESQQAAARRRREAPRCTSCGEPRDGYLALVEPHHTTHPNCEEGRTPR